MKGEMNNNTIIVGDFKNKTDFGDLMQRVGHD